MLRCAFFGLPAATFTNHGERVKYEYCVTNNTAPYCGLFQKVCVQSKVPCWIARFWFAAPVSFPPNPTQGLPAHGPAPPAVRVGEKVRREESPPTESPTCVFGIRSI